jgi:hypothetical protein
MRIDASIGRVPLTGHEAGVRSALFWADQLEEQQGAPTGDEESDHYRDPAALLGQTLAKTLPAGIAPVPATATSGPLLRFSTGRVVIGGYFFSAAASTGFKTSRVISPFSC